MIPIIYEDAAVLLCVKPVGTVSEPDRGRGMPELLSAQLRAGGKPDYIAGVHRLDKAVGGLMLFSRRRELTGALTEQIRRREVEKEYLAVLRGRPDAPEGTLEDLLFHDSRCNKTQDAGQALTLVQVRLHTGRTHQIRVQFAARGLPLLGDVRYGSKAACTPALWSYRLCFVHPVTGAAMPFTCPPPKEYPWSLLFPEETP